MPRFAPICLGKKPSGGTDPKAETNSGSLLSLGKLAEAKKAAFRRGVWFRVLNRVERGVLDLTMKYVDDIKSTTLAKVLTAILDKLALASESMVDRLARTVGVSLAQKMSGLAVGWAGDRGFARYLALCSSSKLAAT